ncbi:MAG: hypothetical protein IRZ16_14705 [Myxococcaceae bacterium]|nr:hypothetical protein [Myxococcaceae bacterium]
MNLRRLSVGAVLAAVLGAPAFAQPLQPRDPTRPEQARSRAPAPLSAGQARREPVIPQQAVPVEPPQNLGSAYGRSAEPPAGDPIPVRRSYAPEMRNSVLEGL